VSARAKNEMEAGQEKKKFSVLVVVVGVMEWEKKPNIRQFSKNDRSLPAFFSTLTRAVQERKSHRRRVLGLVYRIE